MKNRRAVGLLFVSSKRGKFQDIVLEANRAENSCLRPLRGELVRKTSQNSELPSESSQQFTIKNATQVPNNSPIALNGTKLISNCHTENPKSTPSRILQKTVTNR